jgi:hypothetical protein
MKVALKTTSLLVQFEFWRKIFIFGEEYYCINMKKLYFWVFPVIVIAFLWQSQAECKVYQVGATRTYTAPSAVQNLVADGDTVEIDAGTYTDCSTWRANNLFITGVGGYAHLQNAVCGQKGIFVIYGNNITVEYIEFSGATISQSAGDNGAGIRAQGGSFTVRHCYIHDNQDGILSDPAVAGSVVHIEHCEFAYNGDSSDSRAGYEHNMYIGNNITASDSITYDSVFVEFCYTHGAAVGHDIKSRGHRNYILYNRIMDETDGLASRDIDLPNGGQAYIIGNLIEKGTKAQNSNTMEMGLEGLINPGPQDLFIVNNTFVNDRGGTASFINVPNSGMDTVEIINNIFAGTGTIFLGTVATLDSAANLVNASIPAVGLVNPAAYDYMLLPSSPAINAGINLSTADGFPLTPMYEYVHPDSMMPRPVAGQIDQGAYEYASSSSVAGQSGAIQGFGITVISDPLAHVAMIYISGGAVEGAVTIYDILGRPMAVIPSVRSNTLRLDISGLPGGVYFARLTSLSGNAEAKFVVTK